LCGFLRIWPKPLLFVQPRGVGYGRRGQFSVRVDDSAVQERVTTHSFNLIRYDLAALLISSIIKEATASLDRKQHLLRLPKIIGPFFAFSPWIV
jgi:hypothetical protein